EWYMHRHLVSVEVRVVSGANERMNADGFALNQLGFKGLNRQSMQSGSAIKQDRMTLRHLFENVPDLRRLTLDHLLCATHCVDITKVFQPADDKGLKKHKSHFLRQAALMQLELGTDDNHGAT